MSSFRSGASCPAPPAPSPAAKINCVKNLDYTINPYSFIEGVLRNLSLNLTEQIVLFAICPISFNCEFLEFLLGPLFEQASFDLCEYLKGELARAPLNPSFKICECNEASCCGSVVNKTFSYRIDMDRLFDLVTGGPSLNSLNASMAQAIGAALTGCCDPESYQCSDCVCDRTENLLELISQARLAWFEFLRYVFTEIIPRFNCDPAHGLSEFLGCCPKQDPCHSFCPGDCPQFELKICKEGDGGGAGLVSLSRQRTNKNQSNISSALSRKIASQAALVKRLGERLQQVKVDSQAKAEAKTQAEAEQHAQALAQQQAAITRAVAEAVSQIAKNMGANVSAGSQ
jgi:hypothetical protein